MNSVIFYVGAAAAFLAVLGLVIGYTLVEFANDSSSNNALANLNATY